MRNNREDIANRAAVALEYVDRLVELGVLKPSDEGSLNDGDLRRVILIQTLERAGLPIDEIARTIHDGHLSLDFMDASSYDRFSHLTDLTFSELEIETGVPFELLASVRESVGSAHPDPTDRVRDVEMAIVRQVRVQLGFGMRPSAIERWLRVYGESIRRIAETEADWWQTEIEQRLAESGLSPSEVMSVSDVDVAEKMAPLLDDTILSMYHGHQEHTWTKSIIDGVEAALAEAGVYSRLKSPPAIAFLDLTGYTRLTGEHGDDRAAEVADDLARIVRRLSGAHQGNPVKWMGDGVMFHFSEPGHAVDAAIEMVDEIAQLGLPPGHVGIHAGPVLFQAGDYYGQTVNLAARITDYARPGEVLVSSNVVEQCDPGVATFSDIGEVELKGVSGIVHIYSAHRSP